MRRLVAFLCFTASFGMAQPATVRGTVSSATGELLRKAQVTLRGSGRSSGASSAPGALSAETDATGSFTFEGLEPGTYTISAQRNGYVRAEYGARQGSRPQGTPLTLAAGQTVNGVQIKLIPHAVITGKIVDEDGDPLAFTSVQVLRERYVRGKRELMPMNGSSTNDLGEYRIAGLPAGRYFLLATPRRAPDFPGRMGEPPSRPVQGKSELAYSNLYYPGVVEPVQATPIELTAGREMRGIDIQMRKAPAFRIRGSVVDEAGKPVARAMVMALSGDSSFPASRAGSPVRGPDGSFEIAGLMPGAYNLVVNRMEGNEGRGAAQQAVMLGNQDLNNVVLRIARPFEIGGMIRPPEGVKPVLSGISVALEASAFWGVPGNSKVTDDGRFLIQRVVPGKYRVVVSNLPADTYLKAISVEGQDITAGAVISAGANNVEIVLGSKPAEVNGVVNSSENKPIAGATVVLVPEIGKREQFWLFRTAMTDDAGGFSFTGVVPGRYTTLALVNVEDGVWHNPEFLSRTEGRGAAVRLDEGSRETVTLLATQ